MQKLELDRLSDWKIVNIIPYLTAFYKDLIRDD
jgi:hypothetical protein